MITFPRVCLALAALVMLSVAIDGRAAQMSSSVVFATTAPHCPEPNAVWVDTSQTPPLFKYCANQPAQTWTAFNGQGGEGVPTGSILLIKSGSCPTGYTEDTDLDGKTILGTLVANGNVGTTGGSDTLTPSGTVSAPTFTGSSANTSAVSAGTPAGTNGTGTVTPTGTLAWPAGVPTHSGTAATFAGNALGTHAHELPLHGGSTPRITAGYGTGASVAGTRSLTNAAQTTAQVVLLSQAVTAGTPAGTVTITAQGTIAWPAGVPTFTGGSNTTSAQTFTGSSLGTHQHAVTATGTNTAPVFTGTQFDNRSLYVRLIGCRKT